MYSFFYIFLKVEFDFLSSQSTKSAADAFLFELISDIYNGLIDL